MDLGPKRSTVTNLLSTESYIIKAINNDIPVDMILLDFSRAFDTVPHNKIIDALRLFGFSYNLTCTSIQLGLNCATKYIW